MGTIHAATYKVDVNAIIGGQPGSQPDSDSDFLDFRGLAAKLGTSEQWVRRNVRRKYTRDPIPHLRFGRMIRFVWDSRELNEWIERRKTTTGGAKSLSVDVRRASYNETRAEFEPKRKERKQ